MSNSQASSSPIVHTIRFEVSHDSAPDVAIVLDDQSDFVASISSNQWRGFPPDELFAADLPLLPTRPPHRAAIARCVCGVTQCANITALISYTGPNQDRVLWSDFRNLGAAVSSPSTITPGLDLDQTTPIPHDDLEFDRLQYETALLTTTANRRWETEATATARLLRGLLATEAGLLATPGYQLDRVAPASADPDTWLIALIVPAPHRTPEQWRADLLAARTEEGIADQPQQRLRNAPLRLRPWEHEPHQLVLELGAADGSPAARAADLYQQLLSVPIADWARTFPRHTDP